MVNLKIDNIPVSVPEGTTILEAARSVNIEIPTLCYLKGMNEIAACRICCVELVGHDRLIPACDNVVAEGMEVLTNSHKVREARRSNLRLLLSHHDVSCTNCTRSGNCTLQSLANDFNMRGTHYPKKLLIDKADITAPLIRENNKCVMCMRCIQICEKVQTVNIWDLLGTGSRAMVDVSRNRRIKDTECTYCGQCITHCPTAAIRERDDTGRVYDAIDDENIVTVVQVAPAVRAAWAERYGLDAEFATPRRMAAALRRMGFDYVFDTDFTADLTIMEEGSEFIERFTHKDQHKWPMFTSCCPGWVRFLKSQYPELTDNLSTAKSPQQMFGAVAKSYFAEKIGVDPQDIRGIRDALRIQEERVRPAHHEGRLRRSRRGCGHHHPRAEYHDARQPHQPRVPARGGLRQSIGYRHRSRRHIRRYRRRYGRGAALRILPHHRQKS